jgi:hypothetical protein
MRRPHRHQHRPEHPGEEELRRIVAVSGLSPGQEEAGRLMLADEVRSQKPRRKTGERTRSKCKVQSARFGVGKPESAGN